MIIVVFSGACLYISTICRPKYRPHTKWGLLPRPFWLHRRVGLSDTCAARICLLACGKKRPRFSVAFTSDSRPIMGRGPHANMTSSRSPSKAANEPWPVDNSSTIPTGIATHSENQSSPSRSSFNNDTMIPSTAETLTCKQRGGATAATRARSQSFAANQSERASE